MVSDKEKRKNDKIAITRISFYIYYLNIAYRVNDLFHFFFLFCQKDKYNELMPKSFFFLVFMAITFFTAQKHIFIQLILPI